MYLGDVAIALLANLSQPETPEFSQPPRFNEQKWIFSTQSGTLHVHIESHAYWGVGLFNSGYLNVIEITGPHEHRMRLLYDLRASVGRNLWEFKHRSSARKWMVKHCNGATLEGNETTWLEALASAKVAFESSIEILEQRMAVVQKRMQEPHEGSDYVLEKAEVAFTAAELDIGMARKALAEENAPGLERALARAEAALIEADPSTGLLTSEYDASAPLGLTLRADDSPPAVASSDLEIVDLTSPTDEEE